MREQHAGDDLGQHVRGEEDQPVDAARPRSCWLSSIARRQRHRQLDHHRQHDQDQAALQVAEEHLVAEQPGEVVEPDEVRRAARRSRST